jgi:hypothetical protein
MVAAVEGRDAKDANEFFCFCTSRGGVSTEILPGAEVVAESLALLVPKMGRLGAEGVVRCIVNGSALALVIRGKQVCECGDGESALIFGDDEGSAAGGGQKECGGGEAGGGA